MGIKSSDGIAPAVPIVLERVINVLDHAELIGTLVLVKDRLNKERKSLEQELTAPYEPTGRSDIDGARSQRMGELRQQIALIESALKGGDD